MLFDSGMAGKIQIRVTTDARFKTAKDTKYAELAAKERATETLTTMARINRGNNGVLGAIPNFDL